MLKPTRRSGAQQIDTLPAPAETLRVGLAETLRAVPPETLRAAPAGRALHPLAWWVWALGIAVATTASPGLVSSAMLVAAILIVVMRCHRPSAFSRAFPAYLVLAGGIVVVRIVFYVLVGIKTGTDVLLPLPRIPMPEWAAGIVLLGPVTTSGLLNAIEAGVALAALLLCFGAAVALTDPQRTLRVLPASLHLLGTPAVIAMTVAPQLVDSWQRVRRAQALRGRSLRGRTALAATALPVLHDALERSLALAASMDSRGYARVHRGTSRLVLGLLLGALLSAALGTYALLDGTAPQWIAVPLLATGGALAIIGSLVASHRVTTTRYRPDIWRLRESVLAACGIAAAVLAVAAPTLGALAASASSAGTAGAGAVALGSSAAAAAASGRSISFVVCAMLAVAPAFVGRAR